MPSQEQQEGILEEQKEEEEEQEEEVQLHMPGHRTRRLAIVLPVFLRLQHLREHG